MNLKTTLCPDRKPRAIGKPLGIGLMITGALVLLFCIPEWMWTTLLGIGLVAVGILLWRFV